MPTFRTLARFGVLSFVAALPLAACSTAASESDANASAGGPGDGDGQAGSGGNPGTGGATQFALEAPDNAAELVPWLEAGNYSSWISEADYHVSAGPHGDAVKVFYSPLAWQAVDAAEPISRPGGAVVKELTSGGSLYGWAVYVRGNQQPGAASYYFYELIKPSTVYGNAYGSTECTGCHTDSTLLLSDPTLVP